VATRWIGAGIVLATLIAFGLQTAVVTRTGFLLGDFRAFYCAARVASHGADPYRAEPLRSCEVGIGTTPFFQKNPGVTIPAPLPGYAIAALVPLALLPFAAAAVIWSLLLLIAWFACIATVTRFARISWESSLAIFALSLGMLSLPFGEVVPLALAFICLAAYCAADERYGAAALMAAASMIEPHLGLPACIALAVWRPAARLPIALAWCALGALSFAVLGPATNLEYFASVLPAHALSELSRNTQLSLTAVLAAAGMAPAAAIRAGAIWYLFMLVAGVAVAGLLARKIRNDAALVCVPPAFAVFGGTFIHVTQIAAALPAAAMLVAYCERRHRVGAGIALLLLSVPWVWAISPALIVAPLVPIGYIAWRYWRENVAVALLVAIAGALALYGLTELAAAAPHAGAHALGAAIDPQLAEASWSRFTQASSTGGVAAWMLRLPTWAGLALLLILLSREAAVPAVNRGRVPVIALAAFCTLVPLGAQYYGDRTAGWLGIDARAYYCAALAQREHQNPYFAQPLHECESATPAPYYHPPVNVTVPAPYPPYALALFYPLTFLPFGVAIVAWWLVLATALAAAVYALARLTGQHVLVALAALALSAGLTSFSSGNVMPLALAALICSAFAVVRERFGLAATLLAVAMVEPHIALPAAIALFFGLPAIRARLAIAFVVLGALSLVAGGVAQNLVYLTSVLPAHALSEISRDNQYSLSTVVSAFGVSDATAAVTGTASYIAMTAFGIVAALRLARSFGDAAMIVLMPPAFALLGGSFVHTGEIAAAIPACLLLLTYAQAYRGWIFAALLLLAVPWMYATSIAIFLAPIFPIAYLTYALWRRERVAALGAAFASFAVLLILFSMASVPAPHLVATHVYPPIDPRLAEASWRQFVLGNSTNRPVMWLLRLPTWIGLIAFAAGAVVLGGKASGGFAGLDYRLQESRV
jgi:hypothetical protein